MKSIKETSKYISLILRYKPEVIGITLDEHGWANVSELIAKSRLYVHLSRDYETAVNVGSRHGKPVIYKVHAKEMEQDGYAFYQSVNGVWLTKKVPKKYLEEQGE